MKFTLATFFSVTEAQLVLAYLRSRGISAFLADEHILSVNPFYNLAVGGIKIQVYESERNAAEEAYEGFLSGTEEASASGFCPECRSENILEVPPRIQEYYRLYRCFDCDHEWDDRNLKNLNPGHIE
jgi:hypothetical protein